MITRRLAMPVMTIVCLLTAVLLYQSGKSRIEADIYRDHLQSLSQEYQQLRQTYNQAVRKTAVTELIVDQNRLSVAIRTTEGVSRVIPTSFDPAREIFVDYVVLDGRLWIRRIFDSETPPGKGLVIDPVLESVDWDQQRMGHGKAVYRSLSTGRWVITVTGDGSLGLAKTDPEAKIELAGGPPVRQYTTFDQDTTEKMRRVRFWDVLKRLWTW